jgi:hypothetical protein
MPGPVDGSIGIEGGVNTRDWVVPGYVNDSEFARCNRLFCDFIHRGIIREARAYRNGEREEIVAYV